MSNPNERRHYIPEKTWRSLELFASDERLRLSPQIALTLKTEELGWAIINNFLEKMGHYPPKDIVPETKIESNPESFPEPQKQ